ncbi:MAG: hypothetical protein JSR19_02260 [Proteobacteria bacterium]|nr:hypothetical protein [Pseudomonadota bacterium]HQR03621.1 YqjK family protein [Rhodocyclaceae bacterium]
MAVKSREISLALKKQRLQLRSEALRDSIMRDSTGLMPIFTLMARIRSGITWLGEHPQWIAAAAGVLLVSRPRTLLRWAGRGYALWGLLRRLPSLRHPR